MARETRFVHQGAGLHLATKVGPDLLQVHQVARQCDRLFHVRVFRLRDPLGLSDAGQDSAAKPAHGRSSRQRHVRHPHEQHLEQGGARVVRKTIQADIEPAQHIPRRAVATDLEPLAADAVRAEFPRQRLLRRGTFEIGAVHHQPCALDTPQNLRPDPYRVVVDPDRARQRAEGDVATLQRRQRTHLTHAGTRPVGKRRHGKAPRSFRKQALTAHGCGGFIAQVVIDRREPGGVAEIQPMQGHRRRLARKSPQAIATRVACDVHQHIDAIVADALRQRVVRQTGGRNPLVEIGAVTLRGGVRRQHQFRVGHHFHTRVVVVGQQRFEEMPR